MRYISFNFALLNLYCLIPTSETKSRVGSNLTGNHDTMAYTFVEVYSSMFVVEPFLSGLSFI